MPTPPFYLEQFFALIGVKNLSKQLHIWLYVDLAVLKLSATRALKTENAHATGFSAPFHMPACKSL
jgi:hypothetical protein